jgi:hypothetical protein
MQSPRNGLLLLRIVFYTEYALIALCRRKCLLSISIHSDLSEGTPAYFSRHSYTNPLIHLPNCHLIVSIRACHSDLQHTRPFPYCTAALALRQHNLA